LLIFSIAVLNPLHYSDSLNDFETSAEYVSQLGDNLDSDLKQTFNIDVHIDFVMLVCS
jgi:hypothetical protein